MKKIWILAVSLLLLSAFCLVACQDSSEMMGNINKALTAQYSAVIVNVTMDKDDISLNGVYNITFEEDGATVEYSFDKLNELSGGNNPDEYISRVTGTAHVDADGDIKENVSLGNIDDCDLDYTGFNFKADFLQDVKSSGSTFSAKVSNPGGFVGNSSFFASDMTVEVVMANNALSKLSLSYISKNGANITITYLFTI